MNIFVIVVTYNGKRHYDKCFTSLRHSTVPVHTIVVDNASNDGSAEYIKENYPEIFLIESHSNLGFGRANNLALQFALNNNCDFVFLLNQDTWIKNNTIEELLTVSDRFPGYGIYSPMHVSANERSLYIEIEDGQTDHANELLSDCYFQSLKDVYVFKYVNAAAWFIPRSTLETIGGFDPIFFLYGEDDNYLQRLEYHGLKLALVPKIQIIHNHQEKNYSQDFRIYRHQQNRLVYYTNILNSFSVQSYSLYLYRKLLLAFILMDRKKYSRIKSEIRFFRSQKKKIAISRSRNCQKGRTWLDLDKCCK